MAKSSNDLFFTASETRGIVPCKEWGYFAFNEVKSVVVRLVGPPIRTNDGRYAIHCFDRSDGKLKALEGPHPLFEQFAYFSQKNGSSPSGHDATDFCITLKSDPFKYLLCPMKSSPLTYEEQLEIVSSCLNLGMIYKTGRDLHCLEVATHLGLWPKPVWPTRYQESANDAEVMRLVADGIIIRFP